MWLKRAVRYVPFHHILLFLYYYFWKGTWRAGKVGYISARLWSDVWRIRDYKQLELQLTGRLPTKRVASTGKPDRRVPQYD